MLDILQSRKWYENLVYFRNLENPLIKLCKHYLTVEKKKDKETGELLHAALDPVAHFHFSNGAFIGSINYLANMSDKGLDESFGMMVNYIYTAKKLDSNKIKYSQGIIDSRV
jgi:malonyl-CoA decarboxylase